MTRSSRPKLNQTFRWLSPAALDLAEQLLAYDPAQRATAAQALEAPYFNQEQPAAEPPVGFVLPISVPLPNAESYSQIGDVGRRMARAGDEARAGQEATQDGRQRYHSMSYARNFHNSLSSVIIRYPVAMHCSTVLHILSSSSIRSALAPCCHPSDPSYCWTLIYTYTCAAANCTRPFSLRCWTIDST